MHTTSIILKHVLSKWVYMDSIKQRGQQWGLMCILYCLQLKPQTKHTLMKTSTGYNTVWNRDMNSPEQLYLQRVKYIYIYSIKKIIYSQT